LFDIADLTSRTRLLSRTVRTLTRTVHGLVLLSNYWNELYRFKTHELSCTYA